jgi:septal ring factor EnvC (AmiA/AmiB activator)
MLLSPMRHKKDRLSNKSSKWKNGTNNLKVRQNQSKVNVKLWKIKGLFLRNQNSKYQQKQALNFNFRKAIEAKRKDIEEKEKKLAEFDQQLKKRKEQMDQLEKSLQKVSTKTYF